MKWSRPAVTGRLLTHLTDKPEVSQ